MTHSYGRCIHRHTHSDTHTYTHTHTRRHRYIYTHIHRQPNRATLIGRHTNTHCKCPWTGEPAGAFKQANSHTPAHLKEALAQLGQPCIAWVSPATSIALDSSPPCLPAQVPHCLWELLLKVTFSEGPFPDGPALRFTPRMTFLKTWQAQLALSVHQLGFPVGFINPHLSGCDVDSVNVYAFTTSGMRTLLHHRADSSASGSLLPTPSASARAGRPHRSGAHSCFLLPEGHLWGDPGCFWSSLLPFLPNPSTRAPKSCCSVIHLGLCWVCFPFLFFVKSAFALSAYSI